MIGWILVGMVATAGVALYGEKNKDTNKVVVKCPYCSRNISVELTNDLKEYVCPGCNTKFKAQGTSTYRIPMYDNNKTNTNLIKKEDVSCEKKESNNQNITRRISDRMSYDTKQDMIIIPFEMFTRDNAWSKLNNLEMEIYSKSYFIEALYRKYKNGSSIITELVKYAEKCLADANKETIDLLMDGIKYGLECNDYTLTDNNSATVVTLLLVEKIWHVVELESDTWYTPPKHTLDNKYITTLDGRNVPYEEASEIDRVYADSRVSYNTHAEEMYGSARNLSLVIQDMYCSR